MTPNGNALLAWDAIRNGTASANLGRTVRLRGWLARPDLAGHRLLTMEPPCCLGCIAGRQRHRAGGGGGAAGRLHGRIGRVPRPVWIDLAAAVSPASRCGLRAAPPLAAAPLLCLAAAAPTADPAEVLADAVTVETHSHAGGLLRVRSGGPFTPVAAPMRAVASPLCAWPWSPTRLPIA